jgi:hypothetical protein
MLDGGVQFGLEVAGQLRDIGKQPLLFFQVTQGTFEDEPILEQVGQVFGELASEDEPSLELLWRVWPRSPTAPSGRTAT